MATQNQVEAILEQTVRASYGKLLAFLSSRSNDIQACEDALADAFASATVKWKIDGPPEKPEAWIFQAAKNNLIDAKRKEKLATLSGDTLTLLDSEKNDNTGEFFKDERLKLMFVCCHPSIDASVRTPLMLQTVLGLDSRVIASAFLTSPSAMMKKLVRAKQKIKLAKIDFIIPDPEYLFDRIEYVAEAIFAIYGKSWDAYGSADSEHRDLDTEALYLADLLVKSLPDEPEPKGLLAYILHCESRKKARRSADNQYIPLDEQNTQLWNLEQIEKAERYLQIAFSLNKVGRFQIEAAIQSAHSARVFQKINNWEAILNLYNALIKRAPTVGAYVSRAAAISEFLGAHKGLEALDEIPQDFFSGYQPYWALKASLFKKLNKAVEAHHCYDIAIGLTEDESVTRFLMRQKIETLV